MLVAVQTDTCIAEVYDTVYTTVSTETIANICATMPAGQRDITVKLMNAQRQRGNSDCGVFACARSQSVVGVTFDMSKLRCHLIECLCTQEVKPFPTVTVKSGVRKVKVLCTQRCYMELLGGFAWQGSSRWNCGSSQKVC